MAKDSAREFWVHAGAMDVKVLGTSFNVKAYERLETVATTLSRGVWRWHVPARVFRLCRESSLYMTRIIG